MGIAACDDALPRARARAAILHELTTHLCGSELTTPSSGTPTRVTLNSALLAAIAASLIGAMVPAGIALDRRVEASLVARARAELDMAPKLLADRNAAYSDALMMRAKDLAHAPGLAEAVDRGDRAGMLAALEFVRSSLGAASPLVTSSRPAMHLGPTPDAPLVALTRVGQMPVKLSTDGSIIRNVALAPLTVNGRWVGAAGVTLPLDDEEVIGLKGLLRADLIIASSPTGAITATTLDSVLARAILSEARATDSATLSRELAIKGERYLVVRSELSDAGSATFVRPIAQELAVLPALRRIAILASTAAVVVALLLAAWLARRITRPVRQLAAAADALGAGAFDAVLPDSRLSEVATVAERFAEMREALRLRLVQLRDSNEALQERSARLQALQGDLMQRERLAAAGRLVAQLAHEIRNPVASLRNCLEVVRRRVAHDPEGLEFADLAINELLRMHELAEQMLDVSRPRPGAPASCAPMAMARDVVRLVTAGVPAESFAVNLTGDAHVRAAIAGDALKQVLLNLLQNAREAMGDHATAQASRVTIAVGRENAGVTIAVEDNGPGIPLDKRQRVFDPFFSTKSNLQGVGLGLFVAEGLVRSAGGRIEVREAPGGGARFTVVLPEEAADAEATSEGVPLAEPAAVNTATGRPSA